MSDVAKEKPGKYFLDRKGSFMRSLKVQGEYIELLVKGLDIGAPATEELELLVEIIEGYQKSDQLFKNLEGRAEKAVRRESMKSLSRLQKRQHQREANKMREKIVTLIERLEVTNEKLQGIRMMVKERTDGVKEQIELWKALQKKGKRKAK